MKLLVLVLMIVGVSAGPSGAGQHSGSSFWREHVDVRQGHPSYSYQYEYRYPPQAGVPQHSPQLYPHQAVPPQPLAPQHLPSQPYPYPPVGPVHTPPYLLPTYYPPVPQYVPSGGSAYPGVRPDLLDHDQMCHVVLQQSKQMIFYLFGMEVDPNDFSFLQCMTSSELEEYKKALDVMSNMDLTLTALHISGYKKVPRMPLINCLGEELYYEIYSVLSSRASNKEWTMPNWCGRWEGGAVRESLQCAAVMREVTPTLLAGDEMPAYAVLWHDVSFLDTMDVSELCFIHRYGKAYVDGKDEGEMIWKIIDVDPEERELPAVKCYIQYLIRRIEDLILAERSGGKDTATYCRGVGLDHLFQDTESPESEDQQQPSRAARRLHQQRARRTFSGSERSSHALIKLTINQS